MHVDFSLLGILVWVARSGWVLGVWTGRNLWRFTAWSTPRVTRASVTYGKAVTRRYRERAKLVAEHGKVPIVQDLTTGWWMPASAVRLQAPAGGDPKVRAEHQQWLVQQHLRDQARRAYRQNGGLLVRLTVVERLVMWVRREDGREFVMRSMQARMAVAARSSQIISTAVDKWPIVMHPDTQPVGGDGAALPTDVLPVGAAAAGRVPRQRTREPDPVDLDKVINNSGTAQTGSAGMANDVRTFADLESPDIDPFEYPDEFSTHLAQTAQLMHEHADEIAEEVADLMQKAASVGRYVEYMASAEIVPNVVSPLEEASAAYQSAMEAMQRVRDLVASAAESVEAAKLAADAVYGDQEVPRFDKAG